MERGQRRRALLVAVAALALVAAVAGALLGASGGGGSTDPFAYTPARAADYQQRATAGYAHVLYAKSPGGVIATAQRVAALRPLVEAAARASGSDPNRLEAIVFLESAGRPDALASSTPGAAAGLTQILGETARDFLGLRVDQAASARLTAQIAQATARGQSGRATQLAAKRRSVDQRFDPAAALAAAGRYLATARRTFAGREDLATESYHMGIGNLENVLRAYGSGAAVPYVQLFFDSSPLRHPASWRLLDALGDDSDTYLWRVLAAEGIMSLYRQQRRRCWTSSRSFRARRAPPRRSCTRAASPRSLPIQPRSALLTPVARWSPCPPIRRGWASRSIPPWGSSRPGSAARRRSIVASHRRRSRCWNISLTACVRCCPKRQRAPQRRF